MEDIKLHEQESKPAMPNNYLVRALLAIVFCFPFGIPAVVNSARVFELWIQGKYAEAEAASERTKKWSNIAIACTITIGVFYLFLVIIYTILIIVFLEKDAFNC